MVMYDFGQLKLHWALRKVHKLSKLIVKTRKKGTFVKLFVVHGLANILYFLTAV